MSLYLNFDYELRFFQLPDHAEKACPLAVVACPYHLMG